MYTFFKIHRKIRKLRHQKNAKKNTHKKSIISFDNDQRSPKESQLKNVQKAQPTL